MRALICIAFLSLLASSSAPLLDAQTKLPPLPADYGKWETLPPPGPNGGLSPDGKWIAYVVNRANGENELRVTKVEDRSTKAIPFGTQPVFSSDSRWLSYSIGYSESQQDKMRKEKKTVKLKLGLIDLATGGQSSTDGIQTFAFSPSGAWIAMRRYPPEKPPAAPGATPETPDDEIPPSATIIVRNLASGHDTVLGNAGEYVWQNLPATGRLLAIAISTEDKTGNGVQIFDTATGSLRTLDSSSSIYSGLSWRKDSSDLAALRSNADEHREGVTNIALAWHHVGEPNETAYRYDPASDKTFAAGMRVVTYRKPLWSSDGAQVYLGMAKWYDKPAAPPKDAKPDDKAAPPDEQPNVSVWHWRDTDVMPKQAKSAAQDRQRNMLAVWNLKRNQTLQLAQDLTTRVGILKGQNVLYETQWKQYAMERSIGRPAADLFFIDPATGKTTKIKDRLSNDNSIQASPGGHYLLYVQNDHYWTVNVASQAVTDITAGIKTSFIDSESDFTVKQLPPFGVAGWTKDDARVVLYARFDLWSVAPDGSSAVRLTNGAPDQVRYRYVRLNAEEEFIDASKPLYLSMFGIWSKKSGYARLSLQDRDLKVETLIWQDRSIDRLGKAKNADVYSYVSQSFEEPPSIHVGGPGFGNSATIAATNPFHGDYGWGHSELIEYKTPKGVRLQGALFYPAGYQAGKKYPMVVYMYEKLSDGLHRYSSLSERNYYNPSAITSHGYFLLMPDIVFRAREPGLSVEECVAAAMKKVAEKGVVDEKRVGIMGHSWGGFDTVFLATNSHLFAAAVAGAPITDLISNYGNHHWSEGIAETDHIETGQQRMEVPLYEDLQAYIRNSAVFHVQNMTTPLMIEVGDNDGTVFFHQGVELYNIARRAGKEVVLLEYAGEDHGLSKKADQIDYQRRIFAWFGHYLKGEPAQAWMENGETYLDRQRELKKVSARP